MITKVFEINFGGINGNIFLLQTERGFILIDTGRKSKRKQLIEKLTENGCVLGKLSLIILTHGDFDHSGNAAYLRRKYSTKIAMHSDDIGMVEKSDMFWNRTQGSKISKFLRNTLFGLSKSDRFTPDITVEEGFSLSEFGLDGKILSIPGHSKGSIGILTADGLLFCGDLFTHWKKPEMNANMDNLIEGQASVNKLAQYDIKTILPGHGQPFSLTELEE